MAHLNCAYCGKEFQLKPWMIRQGQIYCSIQCANIGRHTLTDEERFWRFVNKTDSCWLWTGANSGGKAGGGYGLFWVTQPSRHMQVAHRFAWELKYGPITDGLILCHDCPTGDNKACVFWGHIFKGTYQDNTLDGLKKGTLCIGEKNNWAKLTEKEVIEIRQLKVQGMKTGERAKKFNVTVDAIWRIDARINWKHLPLVEGESATL